MLFIDASRDFEQGSAQNKLREAELEKILNTYAKRQTVEKYAYLAEYAEIEENDFNLNIPRYVDTFEPEPPVDMAAVNVEISTLKDELGEVEEKMVGYLQELGLDE